MKRLRGFTLIELIIVIAVIAILVAVALPSYQNSIRKSARGQAKADLLEITQALERHYTISRSYDGYVVPDGFEQSPRTGTAKYLITGLDALGASTYALTAEPQGGQVDDIRCGALGINSRGQKTIGDEATGTVSECW